MLGHRSLLSDAAPIDAETIDPATTASTRQPTPGLRKVPPYWYPYSTRAKQRWWGREILEVVSTEFRDRSMEFYRYALESGVTTINGKVAQPDTIVRNGDLIQNVTHRHEPPVTSKPVEILLHDREREFIVVNKPGSIPVHPTGRFAKQSLVEILKHDFGFEKAYPVNRLDRLTSGLMILPTSAERARLLTDEFQAGTVQKEYIARCNGEFPEEEVVCEQRLLTVDRQMGLNIVHPEGKPAKTIFTRMHYDACTDTSVLHCRPLTGRSHQIRVHLQYLGHPISNDTVYCEEQIWGPNLGKGGLDVTPSEDRVAPAPPSHLQPDGNPESLVHSIGADRFTASEEADQGVAPPVLDNEPAPRKLLPRETGHDIGMASPVPLSAEAVVVITQLRNMKDEAEDWGRWRDVVFRTKGGLKPPPLPPVQEENVKQKQQQQQQQQRKPKKARPQDRKDDASQVVYTAGTDALDALAAPSSSRETDGPALGTVVTPMGTSRDAENSFVSAVFDDPGSPAHPLPPFAVCTAQDTHAKLLVVKAADLALPSSEGAEAVVAEEELSYCAECYMPLHPDPKPERLYIFLHALRYTTSLGCFETPMPEWADEGWEWDRSA